VPEHTWSVSRAAWTFLVEDLGFGIPQPFEPHYPYTTTAARDACREQFHRELADAGLIRDGAAPPRVRRMLSILADGPAALVAMAALGDEVLLARACWNEPNAVLAQQIDNTVTVTEMDHVSVVDALVGLIPDTAPALGPSLTAPVGGQPTPADDEPDSSIYDDLPPHADTRSVAAIFDDGIVRCGAFIPVYDGAEKPPLIWCDTSVDGPDGAELGRRFGTQTPDSRGVLWITYLPGDNARIRQALHETVRGKVW